MSTDHQTLYERSACSYSLAHRTGERADVRLFERTTLVSIFEITKQKLYFNVGTL